MPDIPLESYGELIEGVVRKYMSRSTKVGFVPNVSEWCRQRGIPQQSPFRAATCFHKPEHDLIVLLQIVTEPIAQSILSGITARGLGHRIAEIAAPEAFIAHLVLHELEHLADDGATEADCDQWAFDIFAHVRSDQEQGASNPSVDRAPLAD